VKALDQITVGMDKSDVLERAGNPQRTFREASQDHWIYVYYTDDKPFLRKISFQDGRVSKIGTPIARAEGKDALMNDLDSASSYEEYEQKVRAMQQQKKSTP
jgi:outer membrane protein assembly factor BamE (lipoprotein component of BamABCDE complex)